MKNVIVSKMLILICKLRRKKEKEGVYKILELKKEVKIMDEKTKDILRILLAIFLPPVGVFFQVGIGMQFWINLILTFFGYVPGIIHAIWVIVKFK